MAASLKVAIPKERRAYERRVAATPETVKKLAGLGFAVTVEAGAGMASHYLDDAYRAAGATIARDEAATLRDAALVLKVQRPLNKAEGADEIALIPRGAILVGLLDPLGHPAQAAAYASAGVTAMAMELVPRISRAQSMDALSSQSNLAGYKAVLDAADEFGRAVPLMMTAAGTVAPAKVFVLGAGVAGLQAIATARRLGAVVSATDVRAATREQVESLGATFIAPADAVDAAAKTGYAKELDKDQAAKQAAVVAEQLKKQDIAITTALIPGRKAPVLITRDMIAGMKPGSVIVDLAVEHGGNVEGSKAGEIVEVNGVRIVGHINVPSRLAVDASALYARNLVNFLTPLADKAGGLKINWDDEIVKGATLTRDGAVVHDLLKKA
ncbi:MAG: Re/Si-specific NAD(P)(+) transhydrogenase subunit alpha [Alphaproteobacteria bacterium]|nr:Re/Si-specific NAD(P)(+) transhydrogenase subunit alpha [Alphaproteobacteria bacterium]